MGCASAPDEHVGTTQAAYTSIVRVTKDLPADETSVQALLGSMSRTCFLTGIAGRLSGVIVDIRPMAYGGQQWVLDISRPEVTEPLTTRVEVACVDAEPGIEQAWQTGEPAKRIATAQSSRCFLTGLHGGSAWAPRFASMSDRVEIFWNPSSNPDVRGWYLGGAGNARGAARCIRGTDRGGDWGVSNGSVELGFDEPGDQCGLTLLGGNFGSSDLAKHGRVYVDGGLARWFLSATANRWVQARCAR